MDKQVLLESALGELKTPVFLAGFDSRQSQLTLHVSKGRDLALLNAAAKRALNESGEPIKISVRAHPLRKLAYPRSLEHWLRQFDVDEIIHDPTLVMSRARCLLVTAKSCRAALGTTIRGLFFDPDRRTLLVLVRGKDDAAAASALGTQVRAAVEKGGCNKNDRFWTNVQVTDKLPHREMIPIDAKSASLVRGVQRALRRWFAPIAVALAITGGAVPAAATVNPMQADGQQSRGQATAAHDATQHKFGVLGALSVFGDDAIPSQLNTFASAGLQQYFGETVKPAKAVRVAAVEKRRRRPKEIGQVGAPATPGTGS